MNSRYALAATLVLALLITPANVAIACGPADLVPVFSNSSAPEYPFSGFASGNLGIVRPNYPRIVLFAAYRYMGGGTFSVYEREALADAWTEYFDRAPANDEGVEQAVKDWIAERASVLTNEETPPDIYVEKPYSGYDFFPNCSRNAFEVARDTLSDRAASHGSEDAYVREWINGQDTVFRNCSDTRRLPSPANDSMPEWLRKDRAYQTAAAEFYSLNYDRARELFAAIANDPDSPWQEVSEYLVPRTLVRQASLGKNKDTSRIIYVQAEQLLENIVSKGGEYASAAEKMLGLIKYRIHPERRVQELAQNLTYYGGDGLKQDLIDFTWLLDKFETTALEAEEKRKEADRRDIDPGLRDLSSNANIAANDAADAARDLAPRMMDAVNKAADAAGSAGDDLAETRAREEALLQAGLVRVYFYNENFTDSWTIWISPEATDEEAFAEAEKVAGPLTDKMREKVREGRQEAYRNRFSEQQPDYEGGYYGDEVTSREILPSFLLAYDLTDWLFTFQIEGDAAYTHSLDRFWQTNSDVWLVAALSKARKDSRDLSRLMDAAVSIPPSSPAFPTAAYHRSRILLEQGRTDEARRLIDEIFASGFELPVSTRNELSAYRMKIATGLDEFLRFSLRKPFAFEWGNDFVTIEGLIEQQKSYYNPEYYTETREEYEQSIEDEYAYERSLESELMFDRDSIEIINNHFPLPTLLEVQKSPILPEYLRGRFALAIWTRAVLLNDLKTADAIAPEVVRHHPELEQELAGYRSAATPAEKFRAALFVMLKNERVTPYIASGFGSPSEGITYSSKWWCETYDEVWDDEKQEMVPIDLNSRPAFLSSGQTSAAQEEMKKLRTLGAAPTYFGERVLEWADRAPRDPRVPEALYIAFTANDWDKYGCGGDQVMRGKLRNALMTRYPSSSWAQQTIEQ